MLKRAWRRLLSFLVREVPGTTKMPRLFGVAWVKYSSPSSVCMPVPFNIVAGMLFSLWLWLQYGWRGMHMNSMLAYRQGRIDAIEADIKARAGRYFIKEEWFNGSLMNMIYFRSPLLGVLFMESCQSREGAEKRLAELSGVDRITRRSVYKNS